MAQSPLKAVMFWPGHHTYLFDASKYYATTQLDGVLELLQLCNSYVLNDITAVGGHPAVKPWAKDEFSAFVVEQAETGQAIQTIGQSATYLLDLTPFENELGISAAVKKSNEVYETEGRSPEHTRLSDEVMVLQAQSYILLADREDAIYIPERMYGYRALEKYANVPRQSRHLTEERFREALMAKLSDYYRGRPATTVHVPCFLSEVLRNSSTRAGIPKALRQLRDSRAAKNYRELARVLATKETSLKDWDKAGKELQGLSDSAFGKEGMKTGVSAGLKLTAGLTSAAVGALFPQLAVAFPAKFLPSLVATLEYVDKWVRRRTNLFETYASTTSIDLYAELSRLFPTIGFQGPQLQHFLTTKNFGWPNREEFLQFMTS